MADSSYINTGAYSQRTISLWFKADDATISSRKQILWEEGGTSNGAILYLYNGALYGGVWSGNYGWSGSWLSTPVPSGEWLQATLTLSSTLTSGTDADAMRLYLGGYLVGTAPGAQLAPTVMISVSAIKY